MEAALSGRGGLPWGAEELGGPVPRREVSSAVMMPPVRQDARTQAAERAASGNVPEIEADDPYVPPGAEEYRMMRIVRGNRQARRIRLCFGDGHARSPKWAFVLDVMDNLERADPRTPQVLTLVTNVGTFQLDGFGFDQRFEDQPALHDALLNEQVLEVVCFRTGHHQENPDSRICGDQGNRA
jgi:hypothetical protein